MNHSYAQCEWCPQRRPGPGMCTEPHSAPESNSLSKSLAPRRALLRRCRPRWTPRCRQPRDRAHAHSGPDRAATAPPPPQTWEPSASLQVSLSSQAPPRHMTRAKTVAKTLLSLRAAAARARAFAVPCLVKPIRGQGSARVASRGPRVLVGRAHTGGGDGHHQVRTFCGRRALSAVLRQKMRAAAASSRRNGALLTHSTARAREASWFRRHRAPSLADTAALPTRHLRPASELDEAEARTHTWG